MEGEREPKLGPSSGVEGQVGFLVVPCVLGPRVRLAGKEMSGGRGTKPKERKARVATRKRHHRGG